MKKIFLPLFAVLAMASCDTTVNGGDGTDANDSTENAIQAGADRAGDNIEAGAERAGDKIEAGAERAGDNIQAGAENAGNSMEAAGEKMDGDSTTIRTTR